MWAKSSRQDDSWMALEQHLTDAGNVARALWEEWLPQSAKRTIAESVGSEELAKKLAVFFVAGHDVGKASGSFQGMVPALAGRAYRAGWPEMTYGAEARALKHATISAVSLFDWLIDKGVMPFEIETYVAVVAGHHGVFPSSTAFGQCTSLLKLDKDEWIQGRLRLWDDVAAFAGLEDADWLNMPEGGLSESAQLVLTGFIVVCDWIASNEKLFPYPGMGTEGPGDGDGEDRWNRALDDLDFPEPWAADVPADPGSLFGERFDLPPGAEPRPMQLAAAEHAASLTEPSLMLIEAPTGEGKTEAALAAAEVLAAKFGAGGVMVALPTQATSDAMFSRTLAWLGRTIGDSRRAVAALCHGKAVFNDEYRGLMRGTGSAVRGIGGEQSASGDVEAHWWFRGRRQSVLANFTVGTIDQFLFAALKSRFVMLRHLGLVGKVVVLDEIHSADEYMSVYLDRALEWMGAHGVPVIALSATLSPARRCALLAAYRNGRELASGISSPERMGDAGLDDAREDAAFPLITSISTGTPELVHPQRSGRASTVELEFIGDDLQERVNRVVEEVAGGGCVVVVCNTVGRAQETYYALRAELGWNPGEIRLLHSRFMAVDRRVRELELQELVGKHGERPDRLIVVATQVIEQSLDVDFDLMITDLAPMDLLIQRMGRLHRHDGRDRPESMRTPRMLITGATVEPGAVPKFPRGSEAVYGKALLLRTVAALDAHRGDGALTVNSPGDVAALVRATYADTPDVPAGGEQNWAQAEKEREEKLEKKRDAAAMYAVGRPHPKALEASLLGWNDINTGEEVHGIAQVRDIDDSLEVILVREENGRLLSMPHLPRRANEYVDLAGGIDDDLALQVARCTAGIPGWQLRDEHNNDIFDDLIGELEGRHIPCWENSRWLKGQLVMPLDERGEFRFRTIVFRYDDELGMTVDRKAPECPGER